jgi:hypothetical protein
MTVASEVISDQPIFEDPFIHQFASPMPTLHVAQDYHRSLPGVSSSLVSSASTASDNVECPPDVSERDFAFVWVHECKTDSFFADTNSIFVSRSLEYNWLGERF